MSRYQKIAQLSMRLERLGLTDFRDQNSLRLIELTLSRWGERECGDENGGGIERDETTGKPYWTYDKGDGKRGRYAIADKEKGALARLARIMKKYPRLWYYHQSDPRGCALYVGKKSDLRQYKERGIGVDCVYSSVGVAVCI